MTMLWKKTTDEYESSAKVVDGNLILSLPDAINPVVWRMELGSVKASALEVKPQAADGFYTLSLKTPKGEVHDIAPFQSRDHAVRALMRVSSALQSAHGKIVPTIASVQTAPSGTATATAKSEASSLKWLLTLGGVLLVIFLFAVLSSMGPRNSDDFGSSDPSASSLSGESNVESGVPQSADKILGGF